MTHGLSIACDVTDRESILAAKKVVEEKDGKLHILVNKYVLTHSFAMLKLTMS